MGMGYGGVGSSCSGGKAELPPGAVPSSLFPTTCAAHPMPCTPRCPRRACGPRPAAATPTPQVLTTHQSAGRPRPRCCSSCPQKRPAAPRAAGVPPAKAPPLAQAVAARPPPQLLLAGCLAISCWDPQPRKSLPHSRRTATWLLPEAAQAAAVPAAVQAHCSWSWRGFRGLSRGGACALTTAMAGRHLSPMSNARTQGQWQPEVRRKVQVRAVAALPYRTRRPRCLHCTLGSRTRWRPCGERRLRGRGGVGGTACSTCSGL